MSRWNYTSISGTKLFFSTIIHNYFESTRNKVPEYEVLDNYLFLQLASHIFPSSTLVLICHDRL